MWNGNTGLYLSVVVVTMATPAAAQTPDVEVSASYQTLYERSITERFPAGWNTDVAVNINSTTARARDR